MHPLEHVGDLLVIRLSSPCEDHAAGDVGNELHVRQQILQHLHRHRDAGSGNRISHQLLFQVVGQSGGHLVDGRADSLVFLGSGPNHQPPGFCVKHELQVGEQFLQHLQHAVRIGGLDRIGHQLLLPGLGNVLFELFHQVGDQHVFGHLGPDGQFARFAVVDNLDAGKLVGHGGQQGLESLALRRRNRIDDQLAGLFQGRVGLNFLDRRADDLVIRHGGHHHQPLALGVQGYLGLGSQPGEYREQIGRWFLHQRMEPQKRRVGTRFFRLQSIQRGLDRGLVGRDGQRHQVARLGIDAQLGVGNDARKQADDGGRVGLGEAINLDLRRGLDCAALPQLLHRLANRLVFPRRTPGDQVLVLAVDRKPGVGHQGLERGDKNLRAGGTVDASNQIRLEAGLIVGWAFQFDFRQRGFDRLLLLGIGPNQQSLAVRLEHELGVGIEFLHHADYAVGISRLERIGGQLASFSLGNLLFEFLHQTGHQQVLAGRGPNRHLVRFAVADYLEVWQLFGYGDDQRLEPLLLGRRDRIDDQFARLLRGRVGIQLFHSRTDDLVIRRRGHRNQPLAFGIQGDLGLGHQTGQHGEQVGRRFLDQGIKTQHRRVGVVAFRLQPVDGGLDRLLIGGNRQRNQVARLGIDAQLSVRQQLLQKHKRCRRIGLPQAINLQLRHRIRRASLPQHLHGRANRLLFAGSTPGDQSLVLQVDGKPCPGHQWLQCSYEHLGFGCAGHAMDRVRFEAWLILRDPFAFELCQRRLDNLLVARQGVYD